MRVFYIIKTIQIIVAAIVIYRILSVGEICDIRTIQSDKECSEAVTMYLPRRDLDSEANSTEPENHNETRPRRMDPVSGSVEYTVLTIRDQSLEEVHAQKKRKRGEASITVASLPSPKAPPSSPKASTSKEVPVTAKPEQPSTVEKEVEKHKEPTTTITTSTITTSITTNTASTKPPQKKEPEVITTAEVKNEVKSTVTKEKNEQTPPPKPIEAEPAKNAKASEPRTVVAEDKVEMTTEIVTAEIVSSQEGTSTAAASKEESKKASQDSSVRTGRFRLKNVVHNCIPTNAADMLGFGSVDLSHAVTFRLPIAAMIISIIGVFSSIVHAFTNLSRPRRCRTFFENVAQVVLWTICGVALLLIRQDWDRKWEGATEQLFLPLYPMAWHCTEVLCFVMVVAYLVECYFYDYTYYKIYFEETLGNYTVVDRPEYNNSIYASTVEMAEDTTL